MGFADMKPAVDDVEEYPHDSMGDQLAAEPIGYLSSEGAIVYIYIDAARFGNDSAIERIANDYRKLHPKTHFETMVIKKSDLQARRYFAFPRTEQVFIKEGYAAEFDARLGPSGRATTAYLSEQKSVLHVQTLILADIARLLGPTHFGWLDDFVQSERPEAQRALYMQERLADQLAPLTGIASVKHGSEATKYAMVERNGLRLGAKELSDNDHAHLAFSGTPESWLKSANQALQDGNFGRHRAQDIRRQIECELSDVGLAAFFAHGLWRSYPGPVSTFAMATWQSQAIASLRKLIWRGEAEESQTYLKNELMKERGALQEQRLYRNPTGAGRIPLGAAEATFRAVFAEEMEDFADGTAGLMGAMREDNVSVTLTDRDIVIGALCGSSIDLRRFDEQPDPILELARWAAHLRNTGRASINGSFADLFNEVRHDPRTELTDLVYAAFTDQVWQCILDAADSVTRTDKAVVVSYSWGTVARPWSAHRQGDEVFVTGALLYFPITDSQTWGRFGQVIAANGGFEA